MTDLKEAFGTIQCVGENPFRYLGLPSDATYEQIEEARRTVPGLFSFGETRWPYDLKIYSPLERSEAIINNACNEIERNRFIHAMFYPTSAAEDLFTDQWRLMGKIYRNPGDKNPVEAYDSFLLVSFGYANTSYNEEKENLQGSDGTPRLKMIYEYLNYAYDDEIIRQVAAKRGITEVNSDMLREYKDKLTSYIRAINILRSDKFVELLTSDKTFYDLCMKYSRNALMELLNFYVSEAMDCANAKENRLPDLQLIKKYWTLLYTVGKVKEYSDSKDREILDIFNTLDNLLAFLFDRCNDDPEAVEILKNCALFGSSRACDRLSAYYGRMQDWKSRGYWCRKGLYLGNQSCYYLGLNNLIFETDEDCDEYIIQMMGFDYEGACYMKGQDEYFRNKDYNLAQGLYRNVSPEKNSRICVNRAWSLFNFDRSKEAIDCIFTYLRSKEFKIDYYGMADMGFILIEAGATIPGLLLLSNALQKKDSGTYGTYGKGENCNILAGIDVELDEEALCLRPLSNKAETLLTLTRYMDLEDYMMDPFDNINKYRQKKDNNEQWGAFLYLNSLLRLVLCGYLSDYVSVKNCLEEARSLFYSSYDYLNTIPFVSKEEIESLIRKVDLILQESNPERSRKLICDFADALANFAYPEMKLYKNIYCEAVGAIIECTNQPGSKKMPIQTFAPQGNTIPEIVTMFSRLADMKYDEFVFQKAMAYFFGEGVSRDVDKAMDLFLESANLGNNMSMYYLSIVYASGEAGEKNEEKAAYWKRMAALHGNKRAL